MNKLYIDHAGRRYKKEVIDGKSWWSNLRPYGNTMMWYPASGRPSVRLIFLGFEK